MKKAILIIGLILFSVSSVLSNPTKLPRIEDQIYKTISYPQQAIDQNIEGFVIVSFVLNKEGKVEMKGMNASNLFLAQHVEKELSSLKIKDKTVSGKVFNMRFNFTLN